MLIRYKLYKSSEPEKVFNAEMIEFVIEKDDHLIQIDDIMAGVLTRHLQELLEVKKYGIAYVGRMEIVNIEITDKDKIDLTEEAFRHYMSTINNHIPIIWNKSIKAIENTKKSVKTKSKKN